MVSAQLCLRVHLLPAPIHEALKVAANVLHVKVLAQTLVPITLGEEVLDVLDVLAAVAAATEVESE